MVLPLSPSITRAALESLGASNAALRDVAAIVEHDPVLVAQLYRRATADCEDGALHPQSVQAILENIGGSALEAVLRELAVHQIYKSRSRPIRAAYDAIGIQAVVVAAGSRMIAEKMNSRVTPGTAHFAGLMHNIGEPVVASFLLEAEGTLRMNAEDWLNRDMWNEAVRESCQGVSCALATTWKFPESILKVASGFSEYSDSDVCANIVLFTSAFARRCGVAGEPSGDETLESIVAEGVDRLALDWVFVHSELREALLSCEKAKTDVGSSTQQVPIGV